MIVSDQFKYVFVSVPKTASISIQFSLGFGHDVPEPELYHCSISDIFKSHPQSRSYYKFAFIRNPWSRILSLYNDFVLKRGYQYSAKVRHNTKLFSEFSDFNDFCINVKNSHWINDIFLRSQFKQLSENGVLAVDRVGRFENLQADFSSICEQIGIHSSLLSMNRGVYNSTDYRSSYSDEAVRSIGELYKDDIEAFNYEF